jgi:hypothetical protein
MAYVVEFLPRKCETLSSNPGTTQNSNNDSGELQVPCVCGRCGDGVTLCTSQIISHSSYMFCLNIKLMAYLQLQQKLY